MSSIYVSFSENKERTIDWTYTKDLTNVLDQLKSKKINIDNPQQEFITHKLYAYTLDEELPTTRRSKHAHRTSNKISRRQIWK